MTNTETLVTDTTSLHLWRQSMHRDTDHIHDAWPRMLQAAHTIDGYPPGRGYDTTRSNGTTLSIEGDHIPATSVEIAAILRLAPHAWIAELHTVATALHQAAWPNNPFPTPAAATNPEHMHTNIDRICDTWTLDDIIDFDPNSPNYRSDVFGLARLANRCRQEWPAQTRPEPGQTIDGITIGARTNQAETCAYCQLPVVSGRDTNGNPLLKRDANGDPYHTPCYYTVWRSRQNPNDKAACSLHDCDQPQHAKGLCRGHYDRWHRTGVLGGQLGIGALDA